MSPSDFPDDPGSILYHSESSFYKQLIGQELFFVTSYNKLALHLKLILFCLQFLNQTCRNVNIFIYSRSARQALSFDDLVQKPKTCRETIDDPVSRHLMVMLKVQA